MCLFNPFQETRMSRFMDAVTPTATNLIRADHTAVVAYFHKLDPTVQGKVRSAIVRNICTALEIHAQMEEELFYPALRSAGLSSPELEQSVPAHDEVRRLIERVRSLEENSDQQCEALNELMGAVMHHVADEETKLLPMAEQQMSPEVLSELGTRMTKRRLELTKPHATEMAVDWAVGAPMKTAAIAAGTLVAGALLYSRLRRPHSNGMESASARRYGQGR
jgi:hemerythrin superfamily protein